MDGLMNGRAAVHAPCSRPCRSRVTDFDMRPRTEGVARNHKHVAGTTQNSIQDLKDKPDGGGMGKNVRGKREGGGTRQGARARVEHPWARARANAGARRGVCAQRLII